MRHWCFFGRASCGLILLAAACTSKSSTAFPDSASFCAARAKAECQVAAVCAIDASACEGYRSELCNQDAASATSFGARTYDSSKAQGCIDALNAAYGNNNSKVTFAQLVGSGSITDTCERVFAGSAAQGASCHTQYDCSNNLLCAPTAPGATTFLCASQVQKNQGDFCQDPGSSCAMDTYCAKQSSGAYQCKPAAQAGQACGATVPCVSAQRCAAGVCEMRAGSGGACTTNDDCGSDAPYCDPNAGDICTIGLTFATGALDCRAFEPGGSDGGSGQSDGAAGRDSGGPAPDTAGVSAPGDAAGD
jgi:hypothetical protein